MEAVREGLVNQGHQGELSSLLWDQVPADVGCPASTVCCSCRAAWLSPTEPLL